MRRTALVLGIGGLVLTAVPHARAAEGRHPVFAAGTVITQPGRYVVTRNLDGDGVTPVIRIQATNVDLDLNGFLISNDAASTGILVDYESDVRIHNGEIRAVDVGVDIGWPGGGIRAVLEDLHIRTTNTAGIRIDSVRNVIIRRVEIDLTVDGILVTGGPTQGRIESSLVELGAGTGIRIASAAGFSIVDNRVASFSGEGIHVQSALGVVVEGNTVIRSGGTAGIYAAGRAARIARNVVSECRSHGIYLGSSSRDAHVVDNVSTENGTSITPGDGLRIDGLRANVVGNVLNENSGLGLHLTSASGYAVLGRNTAWQNQNLGGQACSGIPALFLPDSCNDGGSLVSFGDNLIPGPPLF